MIILDHNLIKLEKQLLIEKNIYKNLIKTKVLEVVSKTFKIPTNSVYSTPSTTTTIEARHVIYFILKYNFKFTFYQITENDSRNHSTAVVALIKLKKFIKNQPKYKLFIDEMAQKIKRDLAIYYLEK